MARKILTTTLNKEGKKGTIGMIVPDFVSPSAREDDNKLYLFKFKLRRRLYWLRFKAELLVAKFSLKNKRARKAVDDFTKSCNDLANDVLLEPVKDFKPEVIDERMELYKGLKKSNIYWKLGYMGGA